MSHESGWVNWKINSVFVWNCDVNAKRQLRCTEETESDKTIKTVSKH